MLKWEEKNWLNRILDTDGFQKELENWRNFNDYI